MTTRRQSATPENQPQKTVGFGCPNTIDPHHIEVTIPRGPHDRVLITEHFGLRSGKEGQDAIERVILERAKWSAISEAARKTFNERLKEKGLTPSRWSLGENKVERLLGKELCVLAWAVERAPFELVPVAITNWIGLRPEERWWLFTITAAATGGVTDGDIGWRKALRFALCENPVRTDAEVRSSSSRTARTRSGALTERPELSLFPLISESL